MKATKLHFRPDEIYINAFTVHFKIRCNELNLGFGDMKDNYFFLRKKKLQYNIQVRDGGGPLWFDFWCEREYEWVFKFVGLVRFLKFQMGSGTGSGSG